MYQNASLHAAGRHHGKREVRATEAIVARRADFPALAIEIRKKILKHVKKSKEICVTDIEWARVHMAHGDSEDRGVESAIMNDRAIWGIHAGKTGDAHSLFLQGNCIALGWDKVADLGKLPADRETFKSKLAAAYPEKGPMAIAVSAGQLFRFLHEMKEGDIVAYPSKFDRQIHLGTVAGPYKYDPAREPGYPHTRPVKWLRAVLRTKFSQGALHEIGSALSLFQIKNYSDEFTAALEGREVTTPVTQDDTVALVAEDIEETAGDFIIKRLAQELKGKPFEDFVGRLLNAMGYRTRMAPEGTDGGIDIVAHKDELGFEPPIIKVQVKSTEGSVGDPVVSALYGKVSAGEFGLLVTLGTFTQAAKNFARSKSNLRLMDGNELVSMIIEHYEQFDSRYKALLPLKRVWIPEPPEEGDD